MTILIEVGGPVQWRPGLFKSRLMYRVWWLWFAVGILRVPFVETLDTRRFEWRM